MTAPTDHIATARASFACAQGASFNSTAAAAHFDLATAAALIALAEEARTANLLSALDYGLLGHLDSIARRAEITARLWPTRGETGATS